jgi:hypothetical protein
VIPWFQVCFHIQRVPLHDGIEADGEAHEAALATSFGIVHFDWFVRIERRAEEMKEAREAERLAGLYKLNPVDP